MTARPFKGKHYEVYQKDGIWYIRGPHAPGYPFYDLGRANRKARSLEAKSNQTRLRYE